MKRKIIVLASFVFAMGFINIPAIATEKNPAEIVINNKELSDEEKANMLLERLDEINSMNLKELPREDRKAVKKEVRQIKKAMGDLGGGVYLSATAIIIILLILIIIL